MALIVLATTVARAQGVGGIELAGVTASDSNAPPADLGKPLRQIVDERISAGFAGPFAARSTDEEFLRRVWLDLAGVIPTAEEARRFLGDSAANKREALVDRLLASPRFARRMQWALDLMLMERRPDVHVPAVEWREWLRQSIEANKPYDVLVREILSADGAEAGPRPAAKFYLDREGEPNLLTRDVARVFLGRDMQCAQCHDHPLIDDYEQQDYYGLFAYLGRSFLFKDKQSRASLAEKAEGDVTFKSVFVPDMTPQATGPHLPDVEGSSEPRVPAGAEYVVPPAEGVRPVPRYSRRAQLAKTLTVQPPADFQRNAANRLWALVMGRGLVEPLDLHHAGNPPSHPELLEELGRALAGMQYDLRAFLREMVLSDTYQRSSELPAEATNEPAADRFAVAALKPLVPEALAWSVMQATGIFGWQEAVVREEIVADRRLDELLSADAPRAREREVLVEREVNQRLAGSEAAFVQLFGSQPGVLPSGFEATVHQALFLSNNEMVQGWVTADVAQGLVNRLSGLVGPASVAEELYLSVLTRRPTSDEVAEVAHYLEGRRDPRAEDLVRDLTQQAAGDAAAVPAVGVLRQTAAAERRGALVELAWALLASTEFRLNH